VTESTLLKNTGKSILRVKQRTPISDEKRNYR